MAVQYEHPIDPGGSCTKTLTLVRVCRLSDGGCVLGGVLGDIYGRKPVLLTNLSINAISAFLSAFSTSIYWLIFFRALAGLGERSVS